MKWLFWGIKALVLLLEHSINIYNPHMNCWNLRRQLFKVDRATHTSNQTIWQEYPNLFYTMKRNGHISTKTFLLEKVNKKTISWFNFELP